MVCILDEIPYERKNVFFNFVEYENFIWFWDVVYNALYRCKKGERITQRMTPEVEFRVYSLYSKIFLYENKIICEPRMTDKILVYDITNQKIRYIHLEINICKDFCLNEGRFWDGIVSGKYLYLIGLCTPYIVKFNMETEKTEMIINPYQSMKVNEHRKYFYWKADIFNNILYVPSYTENVVFLIDIDKMTYSEKYFTAIKKGGFSSLYVEKGLLWLFPKLDKKIVCWNYETNDIKYFEQYPKGCDFSAYSEIGYVQDEDEKLFLFPLQKNKMFVLDKRNEKIFFEKEINHYYDKLLNGEDFHGDTFSFVQRQNHDLYIFINYSRECIIYSFDTKKIHSHYYYVPENDYKSFVFNCFQKKIIYDEKINTLKYLFEFMLNNNKNKEYMEAQNLKYIGNKIFKGVHTNS